MIKGEETLFDVLRIETDLYLKLKEVAELVQRCKVKEGFYVTGTGSNQVTEE